MYHHGNRVAVRRLRAAFGLTQEVYEINWYDVCYQFELERYRAFVRREPLCKD